MPLRCFVNRGARWVDIVGPSRKEMQPQRHWGVAHVKRHKSLGSGGRSGKVATYSQGLHIRNGSPG